MNSFTFKGVTYEVIPNGNHFTVVDEKGFAFGLIGVLMVVLELMTQNGFWILSIGKRL